MNLRIAILICAFFFLSSSCKKDDTKASETPVHGSISLEVHAIHHTWDVSGIVYYLKKNVTEFPGRDSTLYDIFAQADGYGKYTFEKLFPGNYYLFASGYDAYFGAHVFGYAPVILDAAHVSDNHATLTIYVSE